MQSAKSIAALALFGVGAVSYSTVLFSDDFETGNLTAWDATFGSAANVAGDGSTHYSLGARSMNVTTAAGQARKYISNTLTPVTRMEFDMYVTAGNNMRQYAEIRDFATAGNDTSTLNNLVAIGVYNTPTANRYYGRTLGAGWFTLDAVATVTNATWTNFAVEIEANTARFYLNDVLKATQTLSGFTGDQLRLGSNLSSTSGGAWYDNVSVQAVPEPGTMAVLALGGAALARRRRNGK